MKVVVTGASGQLGRSITRLFTKTHDVDALTRADLDIADEQAVMHRITRARPDVIVNCAAYNDVDKGEDEPSAALSLNALSVRSLAAAANEVGAVLVHYGSDFVFDGDASSPYTETDLPRPQSIYAMSKLLGDYCAAIASRHYVLRLESLFGGGADCAGSSRRGSTIDRIADTLIAGREVKAFVDRVATPSYVEDVAHATEALLSVGAPVGLYHCVNSGSATWYDLAKEMARQLDAPSTIVPVRMQDVRLKAKRPRFCALSNGKLIATGVLMPSWQDAIARYLTMRGARAAAVSGAGARS